jgi:RHS repeat-associated protein
MRIVSPCVNSAVERHEARESNVRPKAGNCCVGFAREFRYDAARARYLVRAFDVSAETGLNHSPPLFNVVSDTWTDYDDDEVYGDYTLSGATATNVRSFQPGIATVDSFASAGGSNTKYYHADLIGTTRAMTVSTGLVDSGTASVYTAFGERVSGANHRYGYAGAWQYQAHGDFPYLHVGHRYYDPGSGRFVQRDPLGTWGGLNPYLYAPSPTATIDPDGLMVLSPYFYSFGSGARGAGTFGMAIAAVCVVTPPLSGAAPPIGAFSAVVYLAGVIADVLGGVLEWFGLSG